jgi:hypothetical protein
MDFSRGILGAACARVTSPGPALKHVILVGALSER